MKQKLTNEEIQKRRRVFFEEMNKEYPSVVSFVATSSGIVEPIPQTQDEWDNFHENLQFVEGLNRAV
jgi:hypothetical protein